MEDRDTGSPVSHQFKGLVVLDGLSPDQTFELLAHQSDHLRNSADQSRLNQLIEKHRHAMT